MNKTDALIIGAGPTGLFTAHQLKLIGLDCEIVDNLDKIGGQCIELYPDKPIYDIPAVPECTGEELTNNLINQLKPFNIKFHLNERVEDVKKDNDYWIVKTNNGKLFSTPNVIIAGGVGSFEPRKFAPKDCEKFENKSIFYSVKDKKIFKGKKVTIFGGGDSALDWAVELSEDSDVNLVHRREEFRGAKATVDKIYKLAKSGKINLLTKYQMTGIKGSQKLGTINHELSFMKGSSQKIEDEVLKKLNFTKIFPSLNVGDCIIHHPNIIHGSKKNLSNNDRIGVAVSYAAKNSKTDLIKLTRYKKRLKENIKKIYK